MRKLVERGHFGPVLLYEKKNHTVEIAEEVHRVIFTNKIGGEPAIAEPPSGAAIEEVSSIRREVALHGGLKHIVVPRIDTRVPKDQYARHIVLSCQLPHFVYGNGLSKQWHQCHQCHNRRRPRHSPHLRCCCCNTTA